jgi:multidrug transporter EmrE-like cation transporter
MGYFALLLMVFFTTCGQLFVKKGSGRVRHDGGLGVLARTMLNRYVAAGFASVILATVAYFYALTQVPLNVAYSFTGLNYVFTFLGGWKIMGEEVNSTQIGGVALIFLGIVTWNW